MSLNKLLLLAALPAVFMMVSCRSSKNTVSYFQDMTTENNVLEGVESNYEVNITSDDLLAISVSSIDPNAIAIFNLPATTYLQPGQDEISTTPVLQSYLVDSEGYIDFPVLGRLHVAGMTRHELAEYLKAELAKTSNLSAN